MSKELEALECSLKLYKMVESAGNDNGFNLNEAWEYHKIIKQALLELKAIKEAKPSEALKALDRNIVVIREKDYTIIEQALLKAQEQEKKLKALEIIKNKHVDVDYFLTIIEKYNELEKQMKVYNHLNSVYEMLTQEEFLLLKEVLCE